MRTHLERTGWGLDSGLVQLQWSLPLAENRYLFASLASTMLLVHSHCQVCPKKDCDDPREGAADWSKVLNLHQILLRRMGGDEWLTLSGNTPASSTCHWSYDRRGVLAVSSHWLGTHTVVQILSQNPCLWYISKTGTHGAFISSKLTRTRNMCWRPSFKQRWSTKSHTCRANTDLGYLPSNVSTWRWGDAQSSPVTLPKCHVAKPSETQVQDSCSTPQPSTGIKADSRLNGCFLSLQKGRRRNLLKGNTQDHIRNHILLKLVCIKTAHSKGFIMVLCGTSIHILWSHSPLYFLFVPPLFPSL
jgi:hypothetical protein